MAVHISIITSTLLKINDLPIQPLTNNCLCNVTGYEIATTTANTDDASTTENVWIVLEGRKARSKEFVLENKRKKFIRSVFKEHLGAEVTVKSCYVTLHNLLSFTHFVFLP